MSRMLLIAMTVGTLLGMTGVAHADPISFSNTLVHTTFFSRGGTETFSFTHDLGLEGFDSTTDSLDTSTLWLYFQDDNDPAAETVDITLNDLLVNNQHIASGIGSTNFEFDVSALLTPDGILSVFLSRQNGDFWLNQSTLTASGERTLGDDPARVPEPSSLILLGTGVLGSAALGRKRRKRE